MEDTIGNGKRLRALVVGGWSPGPLHFLKHRFRNVVEFHDITNKIPTPPVGGACWFNPYLLCILLFLSLLPFGIFVLVGANLRWLFKLVLICLFCFLVYVLVRKVFVPKFLKYAIERSCSVINNAIKSDHYDVVIGFSWGGAIVWWCLCKNIWSGKTMILAPTIDIMASIAKMKFPILSKKKDSSLQNIICVHAEGDPFTPKKQISQIQDACASLGLVDMYECRDSHVFESFTSEDLIEKLFIRKIIEESK